MNDCYDIINLPEYQKDCWLNSIIMAVLYSQPSRDFLLLTMDKSKSNIYLDIFKNILISYYANQKNANIYYKTLKPAELLLKIVLSKSNEREYELSDYEWNEANIIDFYKYLGVNCQDLICINNGTKEKYILNYISQTFDSIDSPINIPDVLVLFHHTLHSLPKNMNKNFKNYPNIKKNILDTSKINIGTIINYDYNNEIEFMGVTYILSSCITNNYEDEYKYHSLTGIFCNDEKKVFNSYYDTKNNPCSLIKYDWDLKKNEEFCFNPTECKLNLSENKKINIKDLCFNFGTGNRTLIYIRKDKIDVSKIKITKTELTEFTPEPVLTNYIEEINRIKNLSPLKLYCELENVIGKPIDVKNIKFDSNRDIIEKILLEAKLNISTQTTEGEIVIGGKLIKKYTKAELLILINKEIKKLKKEKLESLLANLSLNH